ncbi:GGDEF domain-containing protein [Rhodopseudomonas sp. P1]|uniref:GGDEF domain-containing protein n=1 Tax=Rhodopseudomonas sp. P1 TaxID=3434357 RepID=UPI0031FD9DCB
MRLISERYLPSTNASFLRAIGPSGPIITWLISGPQPQPASIVRKLLLHTQTRKRTLVLAIFSTTLMAAVVAATTGAIWAMVWLAVELGFGAARYSALAALQRDEAAGRPGNAVLPLYLGMSWAICYGIGCGLCAISGEWLLILMAGIFISGLAGGISSRNSGTPRYGITLIYLLGTPYSLAMVLSPLPYMYIVGLLVPIWGLGMALVLLENYEVLLNLFLSERKNRRLANYDSLTGLPNRVLKRQRFERLLRGADAAGHQPLTVFCLDLDGFKSANDRFGHAAGDAVLVSVAERLRSSVREQDQVFRVGGDEFVVLLPGTRTDGAAPVAQRIIAAIAEPFELAGHGRLDIGVSIGAATFPEDGATVDDLLRAADIAMYQAKRQGKGRFVASSLSGTATRPPAPATPNLAPPSRRRAAESADRWPKRQLQSLAKATEIRITAHPQIPAGS